MPIQLAKFTKKYGLWLCLTALSLSIGLAALPAYAGAQVVGHISFVKGNNAAQQPGSAPRILGKDSEIFQGDNIQTTERSFVIVEFTDGAKVTVRPNSNFSIEHYDSQSANKNAQLVLHEGGVNASTGDIAKGKPEDFQIKTPTATIKPNSDKAELAIRVCDEACEKQAEEAAAKKERTEESIVARVTELKGEVVAKKLADKNAKERQLSVGKPLYNSDTLYSEKDSYALVVFPDGQKITLRADSQMDIKQYSYKIKDKKDQVLLRLATGGLRMLTGSIGKNDHSAFALDTPVATIGIRGSEGLVGADGTVTTTEGGLTITPPGGEPIPVMAGFTFSNGDVRPSTPSDTNVPEPSPASDKTDPNSVTKEKTPGAGDTSVKVVSGSATLETAPESGGEAETTELQSGDVGSADSSGEAAVIPASSSDSSSGETGYNPFSGGPSGDDSSGGGPMDGGASGGNSSGGDSSDDGSSGDDGC
jgi:hypothetical protein